MTNRRDPTAMAKKKLTKQVQRFQKEAWRELHGKGKSQGWWDKLNNK